MYIEVFSISPDSPLKRHKVSCAQCPVSEFFSPGIGRIERKRDRGERKENKYGRSKVVITGD